MSNIDYELNLQEGKLDVSYSSLNGKMCFPMQGELSSDGNTFFAQSRVFGTCRDISQTEINGIKKYVCDDSKSSKGVEIVFL